MNDIITIKSLIQPGMYYTTGFLDHVKIPEVFGKPTNKVSSFVGSATKDIIYYKFENREHNPLHAIATFYPGDSGIFVQDTDVPFLMFANVAQILEVFIQDVNSSYPEHIVFDTNNALGLYNVSVVNQDVLQWVATMLAI